ncbi:MAG: efflux RND transporter permease subunit [Thermoleophilaceae bacterium]
MARDPRDLFGRIVRTVGTHPVATVAVVGALAVIGLALALRLEPSASTDSIVGKGTDAAKATDAFRKQFGDDAIVILVKGPLQQTTETSDLGRLIALEGCLSANVPKQALKSLPKACSQIAANRPVKVVYGPGTFINTAATQIGQGFEQQKAQNQAQSEAAAQAAKKIAAQKGLSKKRQNQLANEARQLGYSQFIKNALQLALRYGLTSVPSVTNPQFVSQLIFDTSKGPNVPKARFAYLFPGRNAALVQVRLKPGLSDAQRRNAIDQIKNAVNAPVFKLTHGQQYVVSGVPVVVQSLASAVQRSIFVLLIAALVVMAAVLMLVFKAERRWRLLPLGLALAAAAMTYGFLSLAGLELTMASIAALPVLIGLAVDYAIQFHARFDEARSYGDPGPRAARAAAVGGGPTIAGAAIATAAGFLVLLLSPIPMVHGFAVLVVVGIAIAFACALTAGLATLVRWTDAARPSRHPTDVPPLLPRTRERLAGWRDSAADTRAGRRVGAGWATARTWPGRSFDYALENPRRVLAVGFAVAALGWVADTQTSVVSDVRQLVPQNLQALRDVNTLQTTTGVSGEIDVLVRGKDLTSPSVINWMTSFQQEVLQAHGYKSGDTCLTSNSPPELCPAFSLTDLFKSSTGQPVDAKALLAAVPPYFSQAVISQNRTIANLAFGLRFMPLDEQERVIDDIRSRLHPPAGVKAQLAGVPVMAADANAKLASWWRRVVFLVAALAAVFLVLMAIRRRFEQAAVPLIPILFATGWSALVLFLVRIPLNPMSATLGALVIAISTEFGVLLSARYRQERDAGAGARRAIDIAYRSTGAAVIASGTTAIAGFAALAASNIRMLRDFGIVTVVDLTVSLIGVMLVLPAALLWAEEHGPFTLRDLDPRPRIVAALDWLGSAPAALRGMRPRWRRSRA